MFIIHMPQLKRKGFVANVLIENEGGCVFVKVMIKNKNIWK